MKLSTRAELAIRGILVLADDYGRGPVPLDTVCARRDLPKQYLVKIFSSLTKADLDQLVLTAFLEVVSAFSLKENTSRTCMLIRQTTQRLVFKLLRAEQVEQENVRPADLQDLARREVMLANLLNGDGLDEEHHLSWPVTSPSKKSLPSQGERDRLVTFLVDHVGDDIEEDRLNLVIATQIRGERLSNVVRRLYPELSDGDRQRMYQRIKRRHSRALVRLREILADLYCPHHPPSDALPLRNLAGFEGGEEQ